MKKLSKIEVQKEIKEFFADIKNKNQQEIRKIKKLAMKHNILLSELKKKFCKKCLAPYKNPKIRIKGGIKTIVCENCGYANRWKIKIF